MFSGFNLEEGRKHSLFPYMITPFNMHLPRLKGAPGVRSDHKEVFSNLATIKADSEFIIDDSPAPIKLRISVLVPYDLLKDDTPWIESILKPQLESINKYIEKQDSVIELELVLFFEQSCTHLDDEKKTAKLARVRVVMSSIFVAGIDHLLISYIAGTGLHSLTADRRDTRPTMRICHVIGSGENADPLNHALLTAISGLQ